MQCKLLHAEKLFLCVSIAMSKVSPFETPALLTFMVKGTSLDICSDIDCILHFEFSL